MNRITTDGAERADRRENDWPPVNESTWYESRDRLEGQEVTSAREGRHTPEQVANRSSGLRDCFVSLMPRLVPNDCHDPDSSHDEADPAITQACASGSASRRRNPSCHRTSRDRR